MFRLLLHCTKVWLTFLWRGVKVRYIWIWLLWRGIRAYSTENTRSQSDIQASCPLCKSACMAIISAHVPKATYVHINYLPSCDFSLTQRVPFNISFNPGMNACGIFRALNCKWAETHGITVIGTIRWWGGLTLLIIASFTDNMLQISFLRLITITTFKSYTVCLTVIVLQH